MEKTSKKAVFIVYHDLSTEARSSEIASALEMAFSSVVCVCRKKPTYCDSNVTYIVPPKAKIRYLSFLNAAKETIKKEKPDFIMLHDEFTAPLIDYIRHELPDAFICFDSSELNVGRKLPGIKNSICKILYYVEKKKIKGVNLILAANIERAEVMKNSYQLSTAFEIFDNIHRIDEDYDIEECTKKYGNLFTQKNTFVYGGGIAHGRFTFELVDDFKNKPDTNLVIVGSTTPESKKEFYELIEGQRINNITYLGFIPRREWKYLLEHACASFVLFKDDCPNTKYCASGKLYESLFVGTPIICSQNPPLQRICSEYGVGVSSNSFFEAAKTIVNNRTEYVDNINKYIAEIDYEHRIQHLAERLIMHYNSYR